MGAVFEVSKNLEEGAGVFVHSEETEAQRSDRVNRGLQHYGGMQSLRAPQGGLWALHLQTNIRVTRQRRAVMSPARTHFTRVQTGGRLPVQDLDKIGSNLHPSPPL